MDPYATLNLATETSLLCMQELMARGHQIHWLQQEDVALRGAVLMGYTSRVLAITPLKNAPPAYTPLGDFDALVIRKDPPFDDVYLHLTYLLEFLPRKTVAINSPAALRNINEKISTLNWPANCPDTLVTMNISLLAEFVRTHRRVVLKPLDNCSGREIIFADASEPKLEAMLNKYVRGTDSPRLVMAQEYLPGVRQGDKRVFLVDGEPVGWVNRIPAPGSDLANIHQGASCHPAELTPEERSLTKAVGRMLRHHNILLAGLDFIDGRLTEINVTSPSAVRQINAVTGSNLQVLISDAMIRTVDNNKHGQSDSPSILQATRTEG